MKQKVLKYIRDFGMLSKGDGVVAGVSGGADSMCLLSVLKELSAEYELKLLALHVNHGIRGENADRDEAFVRDWCRDNSIPFECVRGDVPNMSKELGLTCEEAGRRLRYNAFEEACRRHGYTRIAIAHNRDDNAETVLFNILRGSGISGVRGISPVRILADRITIIRPLLSVTRAEIEAYLSENGVGNITDETNDTLDYARNRIRNELLPKAKSYVNLGASEHLVKLSEQAAEIEDLLQEQTAQALQSLEFSERLVYEQDRVTAELEALSELHPVIRKQVIRSLFVFLSGSLKDVESIHIEAIMELLEKGTGKRISLPYGLTAEREYERLILRREAGTPESEEESEREQDNDTELPVDLPSSEGQVSRISLPNTEKQLVLEIFNAKSDQTIPKNNCVIWLDYDKINDKLIARHRRPGDFLLINGTDENGDRVLKTKPLKRYFIDTKKTSREREEAWLLACGEHILWVVGDRRDDSLMVDEATRRILSIQIQ